MIIKLSNAEVTIKDNLTWGDAQKIQSSILKSAKINPEKNDIKVGFDADAYIETKYVTIETMVVSINVGGKEVEYSREWLDSLSVSDGDKLFDEVDKVASKKE